MGSLDAKLYIEKNIIYLLQHGYPVDLIEKDPKYFGLYDWELKKNLEYGYNRKSLELIEQYVDLGLGNETDELAPAYSEVYHPVAGEKYPLEIRSQISLFKKRDRLLERKESLEEEKIIMLGAKKGKLEELKKEYEKYFPFLKLMNEYSINTEESKKNSSKKIIINKELKNKLLKSGLFPEKDSYYNGKYRVYKKLVDKIDEINMTINDIEENKGDKHYKQIRNINKKVNKINEELVLTNSRLIDAFIRRKYKDLLVEQSDLYSVCYIGLWKAIKIFDYKKGFRPSTLIYCCMDTSIKRNFKSLTKKTWETYWNEKKVKMLLKDMSKTLGRQATVDDLLEVGLLDMTEKVANNYSKMVQEYSCSELLNPQEDCTDLKDNMDDEDYNDECYDIEKFGETNSEEEILNVVYNSELKKILSEVLSTLTEKEKEVLKLRFGLEGCEIQSLEQVGKVFHVSKERIRQIEAKALRKLRHPNRSNKIRDFLD